MKSVKSSGVSMTQCLHLLLAVFLNSGSGGAMPVSSQFKVHGLNTAREGEMAFLNCFQEGTRPPSYVWVKDGKVIPGQSQSIIRFTDVKKEDAGYYQCGAPGSDVGGEGRYLHVFGPGDVLPSPTVDHRGYPVCGQPFSMHCIFREKYTPSVNTVYTWYKDNTEVKGQSGQTLSFPNVTEADRGEYVCTGREGGVETTSPPSHGYYMVPLVSPQVMVETPSGDLVAKGILRGNLTLTCNVSRANPPVPANGFSWSYLPHPQGQVRPLVGNTRTLTLGPLTKEDRGQYFCQAWNDQDFQGVIPPGNASITVDVLYLQNMTLTQDLQVSEGDPVTLTCHVDSHPTASLAWTVNGQEVRHVTDNVDHYVILSAACSDSNNYTCGASNPDLPGLEIHATVQLTVLCKQAITEAHTTVPSSITTDFTPELADMKGDKELWRTIGVTLIVILGVITTALAVLALSWCRLNYSQRKKLLEKLFNYFCPAEVEKNDTQSSTDGGMVLTENISLQESTDSDEHSLLLERDPDMTQHSTTPEGTGVRRRHVGKRQSAESEGLESREPAAPISHRKKSMSESRTVPPVQGQRVSFDDVYENGKVYVLPLLQGMESKGIVIKRLYQVLSTAVLPGDPPVFLCTESLPCYMHAIVYHKLYGVIVVKATTLVSINDATHSQLRHAAKELVDARERLMKELRELLHPDGMTLLLVLPSLKGNEDLKKEKAWLQNKKIHVLVGKREDKYLAWLQTLPTKKHKQLWGLGGDSNLAFRTAVSSFLSMKSYGDDSDPPTWLVTQEQATILQCTDKLLHIWGPPGSGKTLLLVNRVRRWLSRGKIVVLAVCGPSYELLLHRLAKIAMKRLPKDTASSLKLCKTLKELKKAIASLREEKPSAICVAIDAIKYEFLPILLNVYDSSIVECVWTTSRADFPKSEEFQKLGRCSACLSCCLRSPTALQNLARKVMPPGAVTAPWTDPPRPDTSASLYPPLITVEFHPSHPGNQTGTFPKFDCGKCDIWLKKSLPLHLQDREQWKHWVVLLTGDWSSDSQLTEKLVSWLTRQGVPAVHEWRLHDCVSTTNTSTLASSDEMPQDTEDRAALRARVVSSVDKDGRPAVHVMRGSLFRGLEKPCVLVVHYDWRDDHPDHQSQGKQNSRLSQHRYQLLRATIRCQAVLAVLLLSPSPAALLLPLNA